MTRNMDAGSDFGLVTNATTPLGLILGVTTTNQEIQESNIPERARGIAAEIQAQRRHWMLGGASAGRVPLFCAGRRVRGLSLPRSKEIGHA